MEKEVTELYNWAIALPLTGIVISQTDYSNALAVVSEFYKMGIHVPLLREPAEGGPYEEVKITYVGFDDE